MRASPPQDRRAGLLPEGRRWGFGAHSVLPYLTMSLHARPGGDAETGDAIRNPVFPQMEDKLRELTRRH
jgi:hypothetical protein